MTKLPRDIKGKEIEGFGFALACDFLKELGYEEYPKPDIHLIDIYFELKLCDSKDPYNVYKSIIETAEIVGESAYAVDKTFWLIGSGNLYNEFIDNANRLGNIQLLPPSVNIKKTDDDFIDWKAKQNEEYLKDALIPLEMPLTFKNYLAVIKRREQLMIEALCDVLKVPKN